MSKVQSLSQAVLAYVKKHPDFDKNYFSKEHRESISFLGGKVYCSYTKEEGYQLKILNIFQRFLRQLCCLFYQETHLKALQESCKKKQFERLFLGDSKANQLYLDLAKKIGGTSKEPLTEQNVETVSEPQPQEIPYQESVYSLPVSPDTEPQPQEMPATPLEIQDSTVSKVFEPDPEVEISVPAPSRHRALQPSEYDQLLEMTPEEAALFVKRLADIPDQITGVWEKEKNTNRKAHWVEEFSALSIEQAEVSCTHSGFITIFKQIAGEAAQVLSAEVLEKIVNIWVDETEESQEENRRPHVRNRSEDLVTLAQSLPRDDFNKRLRFRRQASQEVLALDSRMEMALKIHDRIFNSAQKAQLRQADAQASRYAGMRKQKRTLKQRIAGARRAATRQARRWSAPSGPIRREIATLSDKKFHTFIKSEYPRSTQTEWYPSFLRICNGEVPKKNDLREKMKAFIGFMTFHHNPYVSRQLKTMTAPQLRTFVALADRQEIKNEAQNLLWARSLSEEEFDSALMRQDKSDALFWRVLDTEDKEKREAMEEFLFGMLARDRGSTYAATHEMNAAQGAMFIQLLDKEPEAIQEVWMQEMSKAGNDGQDKREVKELLKAQFLVLSAEQLKASLESVKFKELLQLYPKVAGKYLSEEHLTTIFCFGIERVEEFIKEHSWDKIDDCEYVDAMSRIASKLRAEESTEAKSKLRALALLFPDEYWPHLPKLRTSFG